MEILSRIWLPLILLPILLRLMLRPIGWAWKALLHACCGFLGLWLVNLAFPVTGVLVPINPVTVGVAGVLGIPGIAVLGLIERFA